MLAVAEQIRLIDPTVNLVYIGQRGDRNESIVFRSNLPIKIYRIYAGKYRRYPTLSFRQKLFGIKVHLLNIRDIFYLLMGLYQSIILMIKLRPYALFAKGGYVGVPVGIAAKLTKARIITHDSDAMPGLANRLIGRFAKYNAVSLRANYPYPEERIKVVGIPVRQEFYDYAKKNKNLIRKEIEIDVPGDLLFIGGSTQGAKKIDDAIEGIMPRLLKEHPNLHVIHVFGRLNEHSLDNRYKDLGKDLAKRIHLYSFLNDNYKYMAASDLLIGRAGATFLAEAAVLEKACIVIPAAHLAGGHQIENADVLTKNNAAVVVDESKLKTDLLYEQINDLLRSSKKRYNYGKQLGTIIPEGAATQIAKLLLDN